MRKGVQPIFGAIVFTLVAGLLVACGSEPQRSPVIVKVGDAAFTLEDLRNSIPAEAANTLSHSDLEDYVNRWINNQILYQMGVGMDIDKNPEVQRRIQEYAVSIIAAAYLDSTLQLTGAISEREIQSYYDENRDLFMREHEEMHLKNILLPDSRTADAVWRELRRADFDSMIVKYNGDQPQELTDFGYVTENDVLEALWDRARVSRPGNYTRPVQTDFGHHILYVVDRQPVGTLRSLDDVREEIIMRLRQDKLEENYLTLLSQLKARTKIETYFDLLNRIPMDSIVVKRNHTNAPTN